MLNLFWKVNTASLAPEVVMAMLGEIRRLSLGLPWSTTKALLGELVKFVVVVTQNAPVGGMGVVPATGTFSATQPEGRAGAVTPSKFSANGLGVGDAGGGVGVAGGAEGDGTGVPPGVVDGEGAGVPGGVGEIAGPPLPFPRS